MTISWRLEDGSGAFRLEDDTGKWLVENQVVVISWELEVGSGAWELEDGSGVWLVENQYTVVGSTWELEDGSGAWELEDGSGVWLIEEQEEQVARPRPPARKTVPTVVSRQPTDAALAAMLAGQARVVRYVDIYESDNETVWRPRVAVEAGAVTVDSGRDERRNLQLTLVNSDGNLTISPGGLWYDKIIKVYRGVETETEVWLTCLGEFLIDKIEQPHFTTRIEIIGRDFTKKLLRDKFPEATTFATGTYVEDACRAIAVNGGIAKMLFPTTQTPLAIDATFEPDTPRWEAIGKMATSIGHEVFFDAFGYLVMRPFVDPTTAPLEWTFQTGPEGSIASYRKSTDDSRLHNDVVVRGTSTVAPLVVGRATNTNPGSPTNVEAIGRRTLSYESSLVATNEQAKQLATQFLQVAALEQFEIFIDSLVLPWLEAGAAVEFIDPTNAYLPRRFLLTSLSIPLSLGVMSAGAKRITMVGDLGLLAPPLEIEVTATPPGGGLPLSVNFEASVQGGTPVFSYSWQLRTGVTPTEDGGFEETWEEFSDEESPTFIFTDPGEHHVRVVVTDSLGMSGTARMVIIISPLVVTATATPDSGNAPLLTMLAATASGGAGGFTFRWQERVGTEWVDRAFTQNYEATFDSGTHTWRVIVTDANGTIGIAEVSISVALAPGEDGNVLHLSDGVTPFHLSDGVTPLHLASSSMIPPLRATVTGPTPAHGQVPFNATFGSNVFGGVPPYVLSWQKWDSSTSSWVEVSVNTEVTVTISTVGAHSYRLVVTDNNGTVVIVPAGTITGVEAPPPEDPIDPTAWPWKQMIFRSEQQWAAYSASGFDKYLIGADGGQHTRSWWTGPGGRVYLMGDSHGPGVSYDGGRSFIRPRCQGLQGASGQGIACDPADPERVLAVVMNAPSGQWDLDGIYLSTDGGDSWSFRQRGTSDHLANTSPFSNVRRGGAQNVLAFDPRTNDGRPAAQRVWYAAIRMGIASPRQYGTGAPSGAPSAGTQYVRTTNGDLYEYNGASWSIVGNVSGNAGPLNTNLYKSTDGGQSWTAIHPLDSFGAVMWVLVDANGYIYLGTDQGIRRSTNDGADGFPVWAFSGKCIRSMAWGNDTTRMFVVVDDSNEMQTNTPEGTALHRWSGGSWAQVTSLSLTGLASAWPCPFDDNRIVAIGSSKSMYTHNGGGSWHDCIRPAGQQIYSATSFSHTPKFQTQITWTDANNAVGLAKAVLYRTTDGGITWKADPVLYGGYNVHSSSTAYGFDTDNVDVFGMAVADVGTVYSTNGGQFSRTRSTNQEGGATHSGNKTCKALVMIDSANVLLFSDTTNRLNRSVNGALPAVVLNDGTTIRYVGVDPTNKNICYAGQHVSTNKGQTWTKKTNLGSHLIFGMCERNGAAVWAVSGASLMRSTDHGSTFVAVSAPAGTTSINHTTFYAHSTDPNVFYAAQGNDLYKFDVGVGTRVSLGALAHYESLTGGKTSSIYSVAVDPTDSDKIYVAWWNPGGPQITATFNGGVSWTDVTGNLSRALGRWTVRVSPHNGDVWTGNDVGTFVRTFNDHVNSWAKRPVVADFANYLVGQVAVTASVSPETGGPPPMTFTYSATVTGGAAPYAWLWESWNGTAWVTEATSTSFDKTYATAGVKTVRVTVTDANGKTARDTVTATVTPADAGVLALDATATPSTGAAPLDVLFSAGPAGGTPPYVVNWFNFVPDAGSTFDFTYNLNSLPVGVMSVAATQDLLLSCPRVINTHVHTGAGVSSGRLSVAVDPFDSSERVLVFSHPLVSNATYGMLTAQYGAHLYAELDTMFPSLNLQYDLLFGSGFEFKPWDGAPAFSGPHPNHGGKLPGLSMARRGVSRPGLGGESVYLECDPTKPDYQKQTWWGSSRLMWMRSSESAGGLYKGANNVGSMLHIYEYDAERNVCSTTKIFGRYWGMQYSANNPVVLTANTWYTVRLRVTMNTPGQSNGKVETWISTNGGSSWSKILDQDGFMWLTAADGYAYGVNWLSINEHFGGSTPDWQHKRAEKIMVGRIRAWED